MTAVLLPNGKQQFFTTPGVPAVGYKLATFAAGTAVNQTTWADAFQVGANPNPIILDARGEAVIFWNGAYKVQLQDTTGAVIWTVDNVSSAIQAPSASLIPSVDNTFTLGSPAFSWANLYLGPNHAPAFDATTGNIGYFARTAAEITAGVIPVSFAIPSHSAIGAVLPERYGAIGNGNAADTANGTLDTIAIGNAVLVASATGCPIILSRQYIAVPTVVTAQEGMGITVAWLMKTNLHVVAERGASITLANSQSTDAAPKNLALFFTNSVLSNISFRGIIFDMNGANNTVSPGRLNNVASTGASGTGATATITFAAQPFACTIGSGVIVSGITPAGYNGNQIVSASTVNSISYLNATVGAQTVAGQLNGGYNQTFGMGAIIVSGTPAGVAARIDDAWVDGCTFKNCPGASQLVCAQSNTSGVTLGKRWTIRNNLFINGGTDHSDYTAVYAYCDDVVCDGNVFWQDNPPHTIGLTGGSSAYEIHGSSHRFVNNHVFNYRNGMYVANNLASVVTDSIIANNQFQTSDWGVILFNGTPTFGVDGILIQDNEFFFSNYTYLGQTTIRAGVTFQGQSGSPQQYAVQNVKISGNKFEFAGTSLYSNGVRWDTVVTVANQVCSNLSITDNQVIGATEGVYLLTNVANKQGYTEIKRNQFIALTPDSLANQPIGIHINPTGGISTLCVDGNDFIDERGAPTFATGMFFQAGIITDFFFGQQTFKGLTSFSFNNSATFTNIRSSFVNNGSQANVADAGTITHSAAFTGILPRSINLTPSIAGTVASLTSITQPTCVVALKVSTTGAAAANQTVYFAANY